MRYTKSAVVGLLATLSTALLLTACDGENVRPGRLETPPTEDELEQEDFSYDAYNKLLGEYVDEQGMVDYAALKANRGELDTFIRRMGAIRPETFSEWSEQERLAFWINAYNAVTLLRIINHYPVETGGLISSVRFPANSIRQIDGVWTEITNTIVGRDLTLDQIEHEILRVEFTEPRIHAAIVCAAVGCPPLRNEAFVADRLEDQLIDQSRRFLGADNRFRIDRGVGIVYLSPIFDWFGEDFVGVYDDSIIRAHSGKLGAVLAYASRYVDKEDAEFLKQEDYEVRFLDYDWSLNEQT